MPRQRWPIINRIAGGSKINPGIIKVTVSRVIQETSAVHSRVIDTGIVTTNTISDGTTMAMGTAFVYMVTDIATTTVTIATDIVDTIATIAIAIAVTFVTDQDCSTMDQLRVSCDD